MTLTFVEEDHEYRLDGDVIPSVTELLKPLTAKQFGAIPPDVLRIAAERGTDVHAACEAIDYDLEPEVTYPDIIGYINAYEQFLFDHDVAWYGVEEMGVCTCWHINFAGTVDRWGLVDGEMAVVDIKTVAQPSIEQKFSVTLQTELYSWIIEEKHDYEMARHFALYLKKDGDYALLDCDEFARKENITVFTEIDKLMSLYRYREEATQTLRILKERHRRKK